MRLFNKTLFLVLITQACLVWGQAQCDSILLKDEQTASLIKELIELREELANATNPALRALLNEQIQKKYSLAQSVIPAAELQKILMASKTVLPPTVSLEKLEPRESEKSKLGLGELKILNEDSYQSQILRQADFLTKVQFEFPHISPLSNNYIVRRMEAGYLLEVHKASFWSKSKKVHIAYVTHLQKYFILPIESGVNSTFTLTRDGRHLLASIENDVYIWSTKSNITESNALKRISLDDFGIYLKSPQDFILSNDLQHLAFADGSGHRYVLSLASGQAHKIGVSTPSSLAGEFSGDGNLLVLRNQSTVQIYELKPNFKLLSNLQTPEVGDQHVNAVQWSPNSRRVAFVANQFRQGNTLHVFNHQTSKWLDPIRLSVIGSMGLLTIQWSPDSIYLAFGVRTLDGNFLVVMNTSTGIERRLPLGHEFIDELYWQSPTRLLLIKGQLDHGLFKSTRVELELD